MVLVRKLGATLRKDDELILFNLEQPAPKQLPIFFWSHRSSFFLE